MKLFTNNFFKAEDIVPEQETDVMCEVGTRVREAAKKTRSIKITGQVQGVGFRPHVYRLASECGLAGFVKNSAAGVEIEISGLSPAVDRFIGALRSSPPPRSVIENFSVSDPGFVPYEGFSIVHSGGAEGVSAGSVFVSPDIATCPDCMREIFDASDRRYLYPFTNCTNCGPRFTITLDLPYDRPKTTMAGFRMCPKCQAEYDDPADRRFHAQPNACPECGPSLALIEPLSDLRDPGAISYGGNGAGQIGRVSELLKAGKIGAVMGIGGFHIAADASNDRAVGLLRERKARPYKPFALMAPSVEYVKSVCHVGAEEERLLASHVAPVVLLRKKGPAAGISGLVAPENACLGFMLPYTPLHAILMRFFGGPLVMTSGNASDEPICVSAGELKEKLGAICDFALVHNRPILLACDDSVMFVERGREITVRASRGLSPNIVSLGDKAGASQNDVFSVGAILKNNISFNMGRRMVTSQYIGDTDSVGNFELFEKTVSHFRRLYGLSPGGFVRDLNPDASTSRYAIENSRGKSLDAVQHHFAHTLAVMAANGLSGPVVGLSFDGTGLGDDGTVWGGEFLVCDAVSYRRAGSFAPFAVQNYDGSVRDVWRLAYCAAVSLFGEKECSPGGSLAQFFGRPPAELEIIRKALAGGVNTVTTSSLGRIFDVVAHFAGFGRSVTFEGEAAIWLEMNAAAELERPEGGAREATCYAAVLKEEKGFLNIDWKPVLEKVARDVQNGVSAAAVSLAFHRAVARAACDAAAAISRAAGTRDVCLSGGVFFNRLLLAMIVDGLEKEGLTARTPGRISPGDGGISAGQCYFAIMKNAMGKSD